MENKKLKIKKNLSIIISLVVLISFIVIMILQLSLPKTNSFVIWTKENICNITRFPNVLKNNYQKFIRCLIIAATVITFSKVIRTCFRKVKERSNRAKTVIALLDGIIKYGSAIAIIFLILSAFGINTKAIWESVGVLTLIVGLGAQSLIADIIAGVFIIFENEYEVGEIVSIDDFRGTVTEIGIRATKVLDSAGNIKIINNSDIKNVVNLSRELSLASVDCEFTYDVPIEVVEKLLQDNLDSFKTKIPRIVEGPYYKGVSYYGESNIAVKLIAKCKEEDRYQIQRDLLREYRQLFLTKGIDLSYNKIIIEDAEKQEFKTSNKLKTEAKKFVDQQKVVSEGLEKQEKE